MATMLHSESRRLYSWWWDSHISPKNSKWLQDNLTDIDAKVKTMIKLIEEDADSFARRAEMYYKKRPELMKLVEEFYRAYRALAERYDHATGELRHAQRTLAAAFPSEVPFPFLDDSPSSGSERDPKTPDMLHPLRALLDDNDFSSGNSKRGLKQLHEMFGGMENSKIGEAKESNFEGELSQLKGQILIESDRASKAENEIENLKKALDDMHNEKEGVIRCYEDSMVKLGHIEKELDGARMSSRDVEEEANKAKAEIQKLKEALLKLEAERDTALLKMNEYKERILKLEGMLSLAQKDEEELSDRAITAETEAQCLEKELSRLKTKNSNICREYENCLEKVSDLERKLALTQDKAKLLNERAERAENEVRVLNKALAEVTEDREGLVRRYEHCLAKISKLESELSSARDDIKQLNGTVKIKSEKLKSIEEKCVLLESSNHALQVEADSLEKKVATKNEELTKKDEELEKVQSGLQNEHTLFVQAEATLQTLRNLHSQSQREQKALALELKNGLKMLQEMEERKHGLEEEILQVKGENMILNESNSSSKIAMENLESEILNLKEMKERLEKEVGLQMGHTNSLQKELNFLNEDIGSLNTRYQTLIEQIQSVGLDPESVESSIKDLKDENSKLRQLSDEERDEKETFLKKLDYMKQILEKNVVLESSLSTFSGELVRSQEKVEALQSEKSHLIGEKALILDKTAILESSLSTLNGELEKSQEKVEALRGEKISLLDEKSVILSQLQAITENMKKLLERNAFLESSLSGANIELSSLRERTKCLEELCKSLNNDKSNLITEKNTLIVQLGSVEMRLEKLEMRFVELEVRYADLEKKKESTLSQVEELKTCLYKEKQERLSSTLSSEARLNRLEDHVQLLQQESTFRRKEFEEELDKAVNAQFEIFVLQRFIQDMEHKNQSLLVECQKHVEASKLSDKVISELESENLEQQVEAELLLDEIGKLKMGIYQVLRAVEVSPDDMAIDKVADDGLYFHHIVDNIEDLKFSLTNCEDDKDQLLIENSVLLTLFGQLKLEIFELENEKNTLQHEFRITSKQLVVVQNEKIKVIEMNRQLKSEVKSGDRRENELKAEIGRLREEQKNMKKAFLKLQDAYSQKLEENKSLLKARLELKEKNNEVEEENNSILLEALALDNTLMVFKNFGAEKAEEIRSLSEDLKILDGVNNELEREAEELKMGLGIKEAENLMFESSLKELNEELTEARDISSQLTNELSKEKTSSNQKKMELLEVKEKLKAKAEMNSELCRTVERLKRKNKETFLVVENLEKQKFELSKENKNQKDEIENLREFNGNLKSEVGVLQGEVEERRTREDKLSSELQELSNEFHVWEAEAEAFHFDLQISTVREVFLENKVNELSNVCETLENERDSKVIEIEQMKQRVGFLESEVGGFKDQLCAYVPVIDALRDNIASLEQNILSQQEDAEAIDLQENSSKDHIKGGNFVVPNKLSELQHLQNRIKKVEKFVTEEIKKRATLKRSKSKKKLEAALKEIEELKANYGLRLEKGKQRNEKLLVKTNPEFIEMKNGSHQMKDIPLDDISHGSFDITRRKYQRADDQMLELWETSEDDLNRLGQKKTPIKHAIVRVNSANMSRRFEPRSANVSRRFEYIEPRSEDISSELQVEKELGVDSLEVPTNGSESPRDRSKRKILERLNSDSQKLKSIRITVEDLRRKIEETNNKKKKKAKNVDFETVKEQLEEVEDTMMQLVEVNAKLTKNAEENITYSDKRASSPESEVIGNLRRKRVSDQARKGSEKIGRLQIEVQKIQYMLLKLEDDEKSKGKKGLSKSKTSVILRDFISGRRRSVHKRKKPCLCGCFRPTSTPSNAESRSINEFIQLSYE